MFTVGLIQSQSLLREDGAGAIRLMAITPAKISIVPPVCGNGACEFEEDEANCPDDCLVPPVCGDGLCENGEDAAACPTDCAPQEPIPTVSTWGLIIMALTLLASAKGRHRQGRLAVRLADGSDVGGA